MGLTPGWTAPSTTSSSSPTGESAASGSTSAPTAAATSSTSWPSRPTSSSTSFLACWLRQRLEDRRRAHPGPSIRASSSTHEARPGPARARPRKGRVRRLLLPGVAGAVANPPIPGDSDYPIGGRPAFGDLAGGMAIAGGIAAGLLQKEKTGEPSPIIDVIPPSGLAMWQALPRHRPLGTCTRGPDAQVWSGGRHPTRWWATTGPATAGSSPS